MKVNPLPTAASKSVQDLANITEKKTDFKTIMQSVRHNSDLGFDRSLKELDKFSQKISRSGNLTPLQILQYQIQISELNLRVELVSKAAESAAALGRKLQNAQ